MCKMLSFSTFFLIIYVFLQQKTALFQKAVIFIGVLSLRRCLLSAKKPPTKFVWGLLLIFAKGLSSFPFFLFWFEIIYKLFAKHFVGDSYRFKPVISQDIKFLISTFIKQLYSSIISGIKLS